MWLRPIFHAKLAKNESAVNDTYSMEKIHFQSQILRKSAEPDLSAAIKGPKSDCLVRM